VLTLISSISRLLLSCSPRLRTRNGDVAYERRIGKRLFSTNPTAGES
jgi:hypothetical protein